MNLKEELAAALKAARDIAEKAKAEGRGLTDEEVAAFDAKLAEADALKAKIANAEASEERFDRLNALLGQKDRAEGGSAQAKSLGDHFVKEASGQLRRLRTEGGYTVATSEYLGAKANTDTHSTPASLADLLTDVDRSFVRAYRRPTVADMFGAGRIEGNAVMYFVEGELEGNFEAVAPGGQKPQIHVTDPTAKTDTVKKIAGFFDVQDEMVEDAPFMVSEINNLGLYKLMLAEEDQLLNGNGSGANIDGVLNRSGIQTHAQGAGGDTVADALFKAMMKISTATGLQADGLIINPVDYEALRLAKDSNGQYYAGGPFTGPYGNGNVLMQPGPWGLPTVVSVAAKPKNPIVGAFKLATTVYRKGGIRVESTNSDQGKFTTNVVTTRIEERLALAVRRPSAIVKLTLQ